MAGLDQVLLASGKPAGRAQEMKRVAQTTMTVRTLSEAGAAQQICPAMTLDTDLTENQGKTISTIGVGRSATGDQSGKREAADRTIETAAGTLATSRGIASPTETCGWNESTAVQPEWGNRMVLLLGARTLTRPTPVELSQAFQSPAD